VEISPVVLLVVVRDLAGTAAAPDQSVAREAVRRTQEAWDGKSMAVGT